MGTVIWNLVQAIFVAYCVVMFFFFSDGNDQTHYLIMAFCSMILLKLDMIEDDYLKGRKRL